MKCKTKILFTKDYIFKLTYRLTVKKGSFFINIHSEKFEKRIFFSCDTVHSCGCETYTEKLPKMGWYEANALFDKVSDNLVFPNSVSDLTEDDKVDSDEFIPVI